MRSIFCLVFVVMFYIAGAAEAQVQLNQDGFLLVDGKPRLILGVYDLPKDRRSHEDELMQEVADNGFNLMRGAANKAALDRLHSHGLRGWIRLEGLDLPEGDAAARERLIRTVNEFKNHPGLLCWEGPDEALWRVYWAKAL